MADNQARACRDSSSKGKITMAHNNDNDMSQFDSNFLDAPRDSKASSVDNIFASTYDQGWLDGYTTGVLDGCSHDEVQNTPRALPGGAVDSQRNPAPLESTCVPSAQITSREIRGVRGPWGQIIPAK